MIAAVMDIDELQRTILIVIIQPENLKRMRDADPITLESINNRGILTPPKYPNNFNVLIAYEEDEAKLLEVAQTNPIELLRWLERNRKFDPNVDGVKHSYPLSKKKP